MSKSRKLPRPLFKELKQEHGWFLVSAIVMITFLTAVALAVAGLTAVQYQDTIQEGFTQDASLVAEAGVEQSVYQLNSASTFTGYSSPQVFFSNSSQGYGTYTTTITLNADGKSKTIKSVGNVYRSATATTPQSIREVRVTVVGTSSTGYSVASGPGGLLLGGAASITNSNVNVGGTLTLSGAAQIGTYSNPVTVNVANDACPSTGGATYPQVCSGTQPISLQWATYIYGTVCATGQTSTGPAGNNIQAGNGGAGLQVGCTAPVASPPTYDRPSQISAVSTIGAGNSNTYVCNSWPFNRTWPANLELTGNVNAGSACNITVNGNVYITGNLTIANASQLTVANSVGSTDPVIIVDGTITIGGAAVMIANSSGAGIEFISFKSTNSCTTATGASYCSSITGSDLYNSQQLNTITISGASNLPGMIFDSYWSEVTVAEAGKVGAVTGQTVNMNGAGTVVFGTQLSSGAQTWTITSYQQVFN